MFFTDLHVQLLAKSLLEPGEQIVGQTTTDYLPWWAMGWINRQYLVLATDQRLIIVEHRLQFFPLSQKLHAVQSIPWSQVQEARVTGWFLKKKLRIRGMSDMGPINSKTVISNRFFGIFAMMRNNMQGARNIASAFQSRGALGAAPMAAQLPAVNAPGYTSIAPAGPQASPYGAAPQPFGPPSAPPGYPPRVS